MATAVAPQAPTFERIATPAAVLVTMATLSASARVVGPGRYQVVLRRAYPGVVRRA